jgi:hypothetical protein
MKSEILIFEKRNLLMQRVCDQVVHGYSHYCSGTVSIERCQNLVKKFDLNYQVLADRNLRARRKRNNLGNAGILLYYNENIIQWWLTVTEPGTGSHSAHAIEKLHDTRSKDGRIEIDGYELVRLPKKNSEGTKFTWRMSSTKYQNWREYIIDTVRSGSVAAMHRMLYQLWSAPGFAGVRSQIGHLVALYKAEVRRAGRKDAPDPPRRLPYLRRLKTQGISLGQLMREIKTKDKSKTSPDSCDVLIVDTTTPAVKINAIDKNYSN